MDEDIDNPKLLARIQRNIAEARAMNADFVVTPKLRNLVRQIRERNGDPVTERISLAPAPTPVAETEQVSNLDLATTFATTATKVKSFVDDYKKDMEESAGAFDGNDDERSKALDILDDLLKSGIT